MTPGAGHTWPLGPLGPGPTWTQGPLGPWAHLGLGPTWALGPLGPWAHLGLGPLGPGPTWVLGPLGPRAQVYISSDMESWRHFLGYRGWGLVKLLLERVTKPDIADVTTTRGRVILVL